MKVFEAEHWSRQSFDASMVLFNDIVQVFTLTDFDSFLIVSVILFQARVIGPALINVDQTWFAVLTNRFLQKAALVSRVAVKRKSIVCLCLSTAR